MLFFFGTFLLFHQLIMDISSTNKHKKLTEGGENVVTQVQHILSHDSELAPGITTEPFINESSKPSEAIEETTFNNAGNVHEEGEIRALAGGVEDKPVCHSDDTPLSSALVSSGSCSDKSGARQDSDQQPDVPNGHSSLLHSDHVNPTHTDSHGSASSDVISCQQNSDVANSQCTEDDTDQTSSQLSAQTRLQEAIDKVEQLDRSLEKKLKENLEAKAVTADLRALVRRELAQLNGGRHLSREETENTAQFLNVPTDNDTESETSGQVTPIFQTQVRFGGGGRPPELSGTDPGPQPTSDDPADPAAGEPPPPPTQLPPAHDQYFIRRNIELAQEAGGSLAMTEEERCRLEHLLAEDDDPLENAFSLDEHHRRLLSTLDDQLSSLGASVSAPAGSSSLISHPAAGDGDPATGGGPDSGLDYLEATRQDRETAARLEALHRQLELLAAPVEVRPLDRSDVDSMIQETVASLVSAPCSAVGGTGPHSELSGAAASVVSVPSKLSTGSAAFSCGVDSADNNAGEDPANIDNEDSMTDNGDKETTEGDGAEESTEGCEAGNSADGCSGEDTDVAGEQGAHDGGGPASETATEATLDVRSVLSGPRFEENERQLTAELRPGSPTAWLVDVSRGTQKVQLVVPRLSRRLLSSLLGSGGVLPPGQGPEPAGQRPLSAGAD